MSLRTIGRQRVLSLRASAPFLQVSAGAVRKCPPAQHKYFFSTTFPQRKADSPPRVYRYAIDVHGQLFLHDTTPKNLTSCFKDRIFLNFFLTRVKPLEDVPQKDVDTQLVESLLHDPDWPENPHLTIEAAKHVAKTEGYHWISPCNGEYNFVRATDSPIVFRELREDGTLIWAGNKTSQFAPFKLKVDAETGFVYHPSPEKSAPRSRRADQRGESATPPSFGAYSLLSSALVQERLAMGLDCDPDKFAQGLGGSIEWQGVRHKIGILEEADVDRSKRYRGDTSLD